MSRRKGYDEGGKVFEGSAPPRYRLMDGKPTEPGSYKFEGGRYYQDTQPDPRATQGMAKAKGGKVTKVMRKGRK